MSRKQTFLTGSLLLLGVSISSKNVNDENSLRPNILWLTFEDTSASEFGCYGNKEVHTPVIDSLAAKGIQYMNAWSVAPQSSPARSSLITGCYATTFGMDIHPVEQITPPDIFFPQLLRNAGYYCTNNDKTHYNSTSDHSSCWDECSKTASYNSTARKSNQPFFSVFNCVTSHMGRIRTFHTEGRRDYRNEGIFPDKLILPPHVPDLPEIRSDYAGHLEAVQDIDKWVGIFLKDLKEKKLDNNTIIFIFSDHGGCIPRGKGYLYETGLKVSLIVYFPERWKHLAPSTAIGTKDYSLVNFTDFAPTMLSLIGEKMSDKFQGQAFLGKYIPGQKKQFNFGFASNQLHHYMPVRVASDGRYKYIRSYIPYKQFALRNYYQWGMPSNMAWDSLIINGKTDNKAWQQPYLHHPAEMLFDLQNDPLELKNLADDPSYRAKLIQLRKALAAHLSSIGDLGFFIPSFRQEINLYNKVRKEKYDLNELHAFAGLAGNPKVTDMKKIKKQLVSTDPNMRYWATVAMAQLGLSNQYAECPEELLNLLKDKDEYVAAEAAYACTYLGKPEAGIKRLINQENKDIIKIDYSLLECISMDKKMRPYLLKYRTQLEEDAVKLPHKDNEDAGLMARGVLINIGAMSIRDLYKEQYDAGIKLNRGRRPMVPLP
ncbi:MAG: sulfatase [Paludibacter sp.]|nr:sulfatase [Paludibacter sp.]